MDMRNFSISQVQTTLLAKSFAVSSKQVQKLLNSWNLFSHLDHCEFHKINFQVNRGNIYEIIHIKFKEDGVEVEDEVDNLMHTMYRNLTEKTKIKLQIMQKNVYVFSLK